MTELRTCQILDAPGSELDSTLQAYHAFRPRTLLAPLVIEVPAPVPSTSSSDSLVEPEGRPGAEQIYGAAVFYAAVDTRNRLTFPWEPPRRATVRMLARFPDAQRRDAADLVARLRPALAALARARVVQDDDMESLELNIAVARGSGLRIEVTPSPV